LRSLLTILGIVIGIAAVIAMTALIDGIKMSLVGQLGLNQSRLVYISCYPETRQVTMDDLKQLELNVPDYEFVSAVLVLQRQGDQRHASRIDAHRSSAATRTTSPPWAPSS